MSLTSGRRSGSATVTAMPIASGALMLHFTKLKFCSSKNQNRLPSKQLAKHRLSLNASLARGWLLRNLPSTTATIKSASWLIETSRSAGLAQLLVGYWQRRRGLVVDGSGSARRRLQTAPTFRLEEVETQPSGWRVQEAGAKEVGKATHSPVGMERRETKSESD